MKVHFLYDDICIKVVRPKLLQARFGGLSLCHSLTDSYNERRDNKWARY